MFALNRRIKNPSFGIKSAKGDTIVEVLLAMAVASSVLGLTYATMNRNLILTRDSQERTEVSKLLQGQIEGLKAMTDSGVTIPVNLFCINGANVAYLTGTDIDDFSNYPAECVFNTYYHVAIEKDPISNGQYRFYARWDRADGNGRNQITMVYRN